MAIGAKLKQARHDKSLTQEQLAREIGVSWVTISRYERNVTQPTLVGLRVLADVLQVDLAELLGDAA